MKSRITNKLEFQDYPSTVLKNVLDKELGIYKLKLYEDAKNKVIEHIEQAKKNTDFGNCRYIKNLAQQIVKNYTYSGDKTKIIKQDYIPEFIIENSQHVIGFKTN